MKICSVEGCEERSRRNGVCEKHHYHFKKYGFALPDHFGYKSGNRIEVVGESAIISVYGRGFRLKAECFIDACDVDLVKNFRWNLYNGYVAEHKENKRIHRVILGESADGLQVDHIDWNPLNNRRSNLRLVTSMENQWNTRLTKRNKSGFKGVSKSLGKWRADTRVDKLPVYIGTYDTPKEAALAYDEHVLSHRGEYAITNASLGLL